MGLCYVIVVWAKLKVVSSSSCSCCVHVNKKCICEHIYVRSVLDCGIDLSGPQTVNVAMADHNTFSCL